ncbi:hypothetical protein H4219_002948 [Mycoemilia scoparia]|uniref:Uncharacterized protein n=1 Tax=Mycoemilia scoparia TaxID=417184 RepID=A0A9W8A018_9FUNG|nr:hypothetical protein H4219_002948 [Mycoemilia scoparia]
MAESQPENTVLSPPRFLKSEYPENVLVGTVFEIQRLLDEKRGISNSRKYNDGQYNQECKLWPENNLPRYMWDFDDNVERKWCVQWLQNLIKFGTNQMCECSCQDPDDPAGADDCGNRWTWESLVDQAVVVLSELCGKGASGAVSRGLRFWSIEDGQENVKAVAFDVTIHEPSFIEADVGCQTWGSSILFSNRIARGEINLSKHHHVLELGSGTGLCGLVTGMVAKKRNWKNLKLTMTDYLPSLLSSINKSLSVNNINKMGSTNVSGPTIDLKLLDWFKVHEKSKESERGEEALEKDRVDDISPPVSNYLDVNVSTDFETNGRDDGPKRSFSELDIPAHKGKYSTIIAADVLYEIQHAMVIPQIINYFLFNDTKDKPDHDQSQAIVVAPLRPTHMKEIDIFEHEMQKVGLRIKYKVTTTIKQDFDCWLGCLPAETGYKIKNSVQINDFDDTVEYNFWVWVRRS